MTTESTLFVSACLTLALAVLLVWLLWRYRRLERIAQAALGRANLARLNSPTRLVPSAESKVASVTILAIDIREFTAMSEGKTRDEMGAFLNTFFSVIIPIIEEHRGWVSAFLGDGLMAVFHTSDREARPVLATVALVRAVRENWGAWKGRGYGELRVGVGLHQGAAYVGVIGSPTRFTYTAVGESANIAARLESATKGHDYSILISESAYREMRLEEVRALRADRHIEVVALAPIVLKGHSRPIGVYALRVNDPQSGSDEPLANAQLAGTELDLRTVRPETASGYPPISDSPPRSASPPPPPPR